jgi:long-chain acyl-CoA synthetase
MVTLVVQADLVVGLIELKKADHAGKLKNIICQTEFQADHREQLVALGFTAFTLEEIIAKGRASPRAHAKPTGDSIYTFSYTSGTTGDPKGAMITHGNMVAEIACLKDTCNFTPEDSHISYLPLPHIFERLMVCNMIYSGGSIGFFCGDIRRIAEDLQLL